MIEQKYNRLFADTLSLLSPDVFYHPVWVHFIQKGSHFPRNVLNAFEKYWEGLRVMGDRSGEYRARILYAALQTRSGERAAALNLLEQTLVSANNQGLIKEARWAAWGACGLYYQSGDYQSAADYLSVLEMSLQKEGDWIKANLLLMIRQKVLQSLHMSRSAEQSAYTENNQELKELFSNLLNWGESPLHSIITDIAPEVQTITDERNTGDRSPSSTPRFPRGILRALQTTIKRVFADPVPKGKNHIPHPGEHLSRQQSELLGQMVVEAKKKPQQGKLPDQGGLQMTPSTMLPTLSLPSHLSNGSAHQDGVANIHVGRQPDFALYCLGPFRAYQNNKQLADWTSRKGLSIFKYLATSSQPTTSKEILMDLFWPDASPEAARRNLHQAIYALRQSLTPEGSEVQYVQFKDDGYRLNPDLDIWRDFQEFDVHASNGHQLELEHDLGLAMAEYGLAEGLYQGNFLADELYEDWPRIKRQYFWQKYLTVVYRLADFYLNQNEFAPAIAFCQRVLGFDNCQEQAHLYLMRSYLEEGQRHLAIRQYHLCRQALKTELDISPSPETDQMYQKLMGV